MKINRWIYIAICLIAGALLAFATGVSENPATGHSENPLYLAAATLLIWVLTHPAGILAQAVSMPLIYNGIATPSEAFVMALPVAVAMGYVQWYVVVPRLLRQGSR
jgi:hypothetical protein